jgi:hypothetical protein
MNTPDISRSEPVRRRLRRTDWLDKVADVQSDGFKLEDAARVLEVISMNGIHRGDWVHECSLRYIVEQLGHAFGRDKVGRIIHALTAARLITIIKRGRQTFHQGRYMEAGFWAKQGGYIRLDCFTSKSANSFIVNDSDDAITDMPSSNYEAGASNMLGAVEAAASGANVAALSMHGASTGEVLSLCDHVPAADAVIDANVQYPNGVTNITAALLNARFSIDAAERDHWLDVAATLQPSSINDAVRQLDGSLLVPHAPMNCRWRIVDCASPACKSVAARFAARADAADEAERARVAPVVSEQERDEAAAHCKAMQEASLAAMFGP